MQFVPTLLNVPETEKGFEKAGVRNSEPCHMMGTEFESSEAHYVLAVSVSTAGC